ncbi:MAG: hypothetical protein AAGA61_05925 [Pseudomonadota bacterium]
MRTLYALVIAGLVATTTEAAAVEIPVDDLDRWTVLSFNRIPPNTVTVEDGELVLAIDGSASPLVYKLDVPTSITGVNVIARWDGALDIPEGATQGDENADDFVLKLGIVEAGERTLGFLQRSIAADWIKQLFKLAPKGTGVKRINFLSTTQDPALLGSQRTHPLSDLLYENRIRHLEMPGAFEMTHRFDAPVETLGLWISSDGDGTGSRFELRIERIELLTE